MIAVDPPHPPLDDASLELLAQYFGIGFAEKPELWSLLQPVALAGGHWLFRQRPELVAAEARAIAQR